MTTKEKTELNKEMAYINCKRGALFSLALLGLHLFLLVIDLRRILSGESIENIGYQYLFYLHLFLVLGLVILSLLFYRYQASSPKEITRAHHIIFMAYSILILSVAAAIAAVDQILHGQITAYIIALLIYGAAVYLWFLQRLALFTMAHALFMLGVSFFQEDQSALTGHYINGLLIFVVAFILSQVMFDTFRRSFMDNRERQEAEKRLAAYTKDIESLYRKLDQELDKARQIHNHILLSSFPEIDSISFDAFYHPAERIGGDFYDVIQVQNKLVLYLSDVSGHGLDSAMLNVFVKHTIKGLLLFSDPIDIAPAKILRHLDAQFKEEKYPDQYYLCIFVGVLDLETMIFKYASAGFQDALLVSTGDGQRLRIFSKGLFITSHFSTALLNQEEELLLAPGSTIFLNTDGLTEQGYPPSFYRDRLPQVFFKHAHHEPHRISKAVVDDFREFNHGSIQGRDDITFLVMQVH